MAQAKASDVVFLSGRLVKNPTNLASAYPHGGTALGEVRNAVFAFSNQYAFVEAAEYGGQRTEAVRTGEAAKLTCVLRTYDADMLTSVFPNVTTGTVTGQPVIVGRVAGAGVVRVGSLASDKAFKLLFSPRDSAYGKGIIIYNAIPLPEESADLQLRISAEWGIALVFLATPPADGVLWRHGRLKDLSL